MKERPILFSAPMVRAILDGSKTQTRRVVKLPHMNPLGIWEPTQVGGTDRHGVVHAPITAIWHTRTGDCIASPHGTVGDRLWVRETWATVNNGSPDPFLVWKADRAACNLGASFVDWQQIGTTYWLDSNYDACRWRPSIFMPRWASRITLEITDVRVQRLNAISAPDALAEGVRTWEESQALNDTGDANVVLNMHDPREAFADLWDSINAKKHPWDSNPWVFATSFKVVQP